MNRIKRLFTRFSKVFKTPASLQEGTRIRLLYLEGANIGAIPKTGLYYLNLDQYVTITKDSTLIYENEQLGRIYFKVRRAFVEKVGEAPDGAIVYFTKLRFTTQLIYRKV